MPLAPAGPVIRFTPSATRDDAADAELTIVLDTTWTPGPDDHAAGRKGVRDVAERVLVARDVSAESTALLDNWARDAGIVDLLTIEGTSFWYYVRLRHRMWLDERMIWAAIADDVVREHRPRAVRCERGVDAALITVLGLIAARDGFALQVDGAEGEAGPDSPDDAIAGASGSTPEAARPRATARSPVRGFLSRVARRLGPPPPDPAAERRRVVADRVAWVAAATAAIAAEGTPRLLVLYEHARQRVDTADGPRSMNPYLDPIVDVLRGSRLEPFAVDIRAKVRDDAAWERIGGGTDPRVLPFDCLLLDAPADETLGDAGPLADAIRSQGERVPMLAAGIDLAGIVSAEVAATAAEIMPVRERAVRRIRRFLERTRPAGILLADEYHRQDWIAAARLLRIPVAAVQHGMIHRYHNGYIHQDRPSTLQLPDRLYVFGRWERELLLTRSVFRDDEVVVGGSPRLDLRPAARSDPAAIRTELGIPPERRLLVLSGTWGPLLRRFHYPVVLARLADRPLPGVEVVIKLHPGEPDDGPYRAVMDGVAAVGGHAPPSVRTVQWIDLYALLAAADAHIGIHSTVLTEAVATRTPNLLASLLAEADMLDYVEAGVAIPVRDGGDVLRALDQLDAGTFEAAAQAFSEAHFEPGSASRRIADDLLAWLP